jgi:hypothetical protein
MQRPIAENRAFSGVAVKRITSITADTPED